MTLRVFPRRTRATPTDPLAFVGPPDLFAPEADEVLVSVAFTWDLPEAERLARAWATRGPVTIGGPALDDPGGEFEPGKFLALGHTITSRGCPNHCWFCMVPKREGTVRELTIHPGHIVHDSNLLACSEAHVRAVFAMLREQPKRARLAGGLDASLLRPWHVELLADLRLDTAWFAYDTPGDREPIAAAAKLLAGTHLFRQRKLMCYCLVGYRGDTMNSAEERLRFVGGLGFLPMAMLYRDAAWRKHERQDWRRFTRIWARPTMVASQLAGVG